MTIIPTITALFVLLFGQVHESSHNTHCVRCTLCHTRRDVGWLRIPQQYYEESVCEITMSVICHLDSLGDLTSLKVFFLWKWWTEQRHKDLLKKTDRKWEN